MKELSSYSIMAEGHPMKVSIIEDKPVNLYSISLMDISDASKLIIKKIREEIVSEVSLTFEKKEKESVRKSVERDFREKVLKLMKLVFAELDEKTLEDITTHVVLTSLGLGEMEYLLRDDALEEVVVNSSKKPLWVYHKEHGWLKTNIQFETEEEIRHFSTMIGRNVNKDITILRPLLDARLSTGDRVNATLMPVTTDGNTMTIRKFAPKPWTITDFIEKKTVTYEVAALIWLAVQYEQSIFVVGGTGSGKTSALNVFSNFMPPNQRILSIESTRELRLPNSLHWVPMETRLPNPEGKGEITMLDLMINSLRMRPDRIIVGEVRRKEEVEVLLEAMRTGHSGYATFHATTVKDTINRLINPPMNFPKTELSSIGLVVVQYRNRRTGQRRTFQVAEVLESGEPNLLMQHDVAKDEMKKLNESKVIAEQLQLFAGMDKASMKKDLDEKIKILKWIVSKGIRDVNEIGLIMSDYYTDKANLLKRIGGAK